MKELNKYTVYVHTFPNGKKYVGITCSEPIELRWANGKGYYGHKKMREAIEEFGWENVTHQIIESKLTQSEACEMEKQLIQKLKTNDEKYGYNGKPGGNANKAYANVETKSKIIQIKIENSEYSNLKKQAYKHDMNISEFLRWLIEKQRKEDEKNGELQRLRAL